MLTRQPHRRKAQSRVRIDIYGHWASVKRSDVEAVLSPVVSVESWQFDIDADNHIVRHRATDQLLSRTEDGRLVFPAGLVARAASQLRRHGFIPVVVNHTLFPRVYASRRVLRSKKVTSDERELLAAAASHLGGQLAVRSTASALKTMAQLCRLFPRKHVLVVVPNNAAELETATQLRRCLSRKVSLCADLESWSNAAHRLLVMDVQKLGSYGPRSEDFEIVIFLDSQPALGKRALLSLLQMNQTVFFGIRSARPASHSNELLLEAIFGPAIWTQPDPRDNLRQVEVHFATPPSTPCTDIDSPLARLRQTVWCNAKRNRAIADIAAAFASRDLQALWPYGLLLTAPKTLFRRYLRKHPKVVILVESLEHARELAALLPEWRIRGADIPWWERMTNEEVNHRTIVTASCAHEDGIFADVVIRADGTNARWDPKYGPHKNSANVKPTPLTLVDLDGDCDNRSRTDAESRIQDYESRGWTLNHVPLPSTDSTVRER